MGLNMKRLLFLTFLAITLPLVLFAFVGCMKKPEVKADYGPEVPLTEIQKAVNDQAPPDIESIKKGQYVSLDETQAIDVQSSFTYYQRLDEVTNFSLSGNITTLTFRITTNELLDGKWTESVQDNMNVAYRNVPATAVPSALSSVGVSPHNIIGTKSALSIQSLRKADAAAAKKITYHNLVREMGITPIPQAVAKQADCGGLNAQVCSSGLRFLKIKFDRVIWDSEEHGTKTTMTLTYSPDIPTYIYSWDDLTSDLEITNQLKTCAQSWIEIGNGSGGKQTVPVMNCAEVRDFQFGSDTP